MLSSRLIHLIERHSEQFNKRLLQSIRRDDRLKCFARLPDSQLLYRFEDLCQHLGKWLALDDDKYLQSRYESLGRERFNKGLPLDEMVLLAQLVQRGLIKYVRVEAFEQNAVEIYEERDIERLIQAFFDKVVYHLVRGYEGAVLESVCMYQQQDGILASPAWVTLCRIRPD